MGTKIQCKTYLPGFCSMTDLNNNGTNIPWLLPNHENKSRRSSQCPDSFLSPEPVDGCFEHDKEIVRQTILKHETIFRHQLQELHRLYKRQRDLMSEHQRTEMLNSRMNTFQSSPSLSQVPSPDMKKIWPVSHFPSLDSIAGQLSITDVSKNQSSFKFIENDGRSSHFSSHATKGSKECESHQQGNSLFQRKMCDSRFVVDGCMTNDKEHPTKKQWGLPCIQGNPVEGIYQIPRSRDAKTPVSGVLEFHSGAHTDRHNFSKRTAELADLNKPLPVEKAPPLVPDINISTVTCLEDDVYGGGKFSPKSLKGRIGGICLNEPSCRNGEEQLIFRFNADKKQPDNKPTGRLETAGNLPKAFLSSQSHELFNDTVFEETKTPHQRKKTIFGVEINEEIQTQSASCSNVPSSSHTRQPLSQSYTELLQNVEAYRGNKHMSSDVRSHSTSNGVPSYQNVLGKKSQLIAKEVRDCSLAGCDSACKLEHCYPKHDWTKTCSPVNDMESKSAVLKIDRETSCVSRAQTAGKTPVSVDCQRKPENSLKTLPWLAVKSQERIEQIKGRENCYHLNLDSLQNDSQQFFRREDTAVSSSQIFDQRQGTFSSRSTKDTDFQKIDVSDSTKVRTLFGVPIFSASKDSHAALSKSEFPDVDSVTATKVSRDETVSRGQVEAKDSVQEKGLNGCISGLRHQIDLNLTLDEEEVPPAPPLPHAVVKIATTEIDLEAPAVLESDAECGNSIHTLEEFNKSNEESMRLAAESIISISMSDANGDDGLQTEHNDCLKWFAEFVSFHCSGQECIDEESIPDGYDYFEFMTLNLEDMKEEEYLCTMPTLENHNDEEPGPVNLGKRPRRGQAKRGRHRKDFQRDVLPGIISLSRYEVNKDILKFEELFKANGSSWQSRLSHRKTGKSGRGRKRLGGADPASTMPADCTPPPVNQPCSSELALEEKSLTGWGKRTRRLPRQRYLNSNLALPLKQC